MLAKHELRTYSGTEKVWAGKYRNSHNLLHWHYDCELLCVEDGYIEVFCDKRTHVLEKGEAMLIESGEVHYMHARQDTILIVFIFDHNMIKNITDAYQLRHPKLTGAYDIPGIYKKIRTELTGKESFYEIRVKNDLVNLIIDIYRNEEVAARQEKNSAIHDFKKLFNEINEKFEFITFAEASDYMGMSQAYFSRLFHQTTGMTFSQYLNYVKVENAIQRITSGNTLSITDIAIKCGFGTIRNFNRTFKMLTGYAPKKLPSGFTLDEKFAYLSSESFNPTLRGCELIESL